MVKIWDRLSGKAYSAIESDHQLNDLAVYPGSGLLLMANEQPELQVHFIPSLGPAPRWCSFLDNITEELEESDVTEIYDDYKFITRDQISDLGLDHLIGTSLLRAYMHGYFMDIRLFRKAQSIVGPNVERDILKDKIQKKLQESKQKRVVSNNDKLPAVNKNVYLKLKEQQSKGKKEAALLEDERFKGMFEDDKFAIDTNEEAYKLLNPVISKLDETRAKQIENSLLNQDEAMSGDAAAAESPDDFTSESSSSEDEVVTQNIKREFRQIQTESKRKAREEAAMKFVELKEGQRSSKVPKKNTQSLESRINDENESGGVISRKDGHQMTFRKKKSKKELQEELRNKAHKQERIQVRRSAVKLKFRADKD